MMTVPRQKPPAAELDTNTENFFADLEAIRLSPEDTAQIGTREILTRVPVRRPRRTEFFRCHSDPVMSLAVTIYVDRDEQDDVYFVAPAMRGLLAEDLKAVLLQLTVNRKGVVFIWPLTLPSDDNSLGRSWHESVRKAEGHLSDPQWPDKSFGELLTIAFADRIIMSEDHPVVRRLRGLV